MSLFLEKGVECLSRIVGSAAAGRCFFLDHDPDRIEGAIVSLIFASDPGGYILRTFKTAGGVEVAALFAGV
jgi:hypothetical protein